MCALCVRNERFGDDAASAATVAFASCEFFRTNIHRMRLYCLSTDDATCHAVDATILRQNNERTENARHFASECARDNKQLLIYFVFVLIQTAPTKVESAFNVPFCSHKFPCGKLASCLWLVATFFFILDNSPLTLLMKIVRDNIVMWFAMIAKQARARLVFFHSRNNRNYGWMQRWHESHKFFYYYNTVDRTFPQQKNKFQLHVPATDWIHAKFRVIFLLRHICIMWIY